MLSDEGNENGEQTTIGLINNHKNNFARAVHFFVHFFGRCFALPQRVTSRNFLVHSLIFTLVVLPTNGPFLALRCSFSR